MEITIKIGPNTLSVSPPIEYQAMNLIKHKLRFRVYGYQFTRAGQNGWDGYKYLFSAKQVAPSGVYWRLKTTLEYMGYSVNLKYVNDVLPAGPVELKVDSFPLKEFQKRAVAIAVKRRYGIISAPVRAGKTAILSAIIKRISVFPVFVVTKDCDLVVQTKKDIQEHTGLKVGSFYDGSFEDGDVIITHYGALPSLYADKRNIKEKTKLRNDAVKDRIKNAKVLLLDECHMSYAAAARKSIERFVSVGYKIGVSGTPVPDNVPLKEVESVIGPILYRVKFDTLIKSKRIVQPIVHVYDLPSAWFTEKSKDYEYIYDTDIVSNKRRNYLISKIASELRRQHKTCFIMVQKIEHGKTLRGLIPGSFFVNGSIDPETRAQIYKSVQEKKLHCIIGTVGKVGLNIPKLDAVINAEGLKSHVATVQKMRSLTFCL